MRVCRARPSLRLRRRVHTTTPHLVSINAFVAVADGQRAPHASCGPLAGLPVAVKDNICTAAFNTTCASAMLQDFRPAYNATVVDLLQQAGAHICGKTNCDEFGMGSLNLHSMHGPVLNPFHAYERRTAGGSSGGSAAAVAAGLCFGALATDTGGSTRLPAAYCGVVGLKPSYGLLSRWGVVAFADSLDTVGIMARRVRDVRRIFDVVARFDAKDPTSIPVDLRLRARRHTETSLPSALRVGIPQEYFPAEIDTSVLAPYRAALARLKAVGVALVPVSLPATPYALSAYYVLSSAEASSNMARYDGVRYGAAVAPPDASTQSHAAPQGYAHSRSRGFGREVQKRVLLGTYALTADAFDNYFLRAQRLRTLVRADFDRVFRAPNVLSGAAADGDEDGDGDGVDVLLHPSAIRTAPPLAEAQAQAQGRGANVQDVQGLGAYVQDVLTVPASLAGLPALSVPAGVGGDGWPVGCSIVGQWGGEEMLFKLGELLESSQT